VGELLMMQTDVISDVPATSGARWRVDDLSTREITVDRRAASYASGGRGLPVLFLHGWGLDHRAYQRSLQRLTARGCRVLSPSLPGFGRTAELPWKDRNLDGYAEWVAHFLDAVGGDEPVLVLGHSFGGGVATKFAHDYPERARYLVLLNSVGAPASFATNGLGAAFDLTGRMLVQPVLDALWPSADGIMTTGLIHRVFLANLVRNPLAVVQAGRLAMSADLATEMATLAERQLPVLVLWSDRDGVIPLSAFDTFCSTFGTDGHVVRGGHSWVLANPDVFGEVLDNVIRMQSAEDGARAATANTSQLRELLANTTVPRKVVARLLDGVSPLWVLSQAPEVLAADLALCHPRLRAGEVRAAARPISSTNAFRLTVVAGDRPGLLADTAATLAEEGLSVLSASAMTWPRERIALHALTVESPIDFDSDRWADLGKRLHELAAGSSPRSRFVPSGRARVTLTGGGDGKSIVRVTAADRLGLLSAVCRWFADEGVSIEAADIETVNGIANDVFLIDGECRIDDLATTLSEEPASRVPHCAALLDTLLRAVRRSTPTSGP
jgi:pimeloyl-ACP methyl ester carboxylesterase/predicted amino acid-binding ACT domain protein